VGCWEDVEFCEFAPVSIVDQVNVFYLYGENETQRPGTGNHYFSSYSMSYVDIMCSLCLHIYQQ